MGAMSGTARLAAGLIAGVAWLGLAVQFEASLTRIGSVGATVWAMLLYFTVIANLVVAITLTGVALGSRACASPRLLGAITMAILLVGIVYALLLKGMLELSGGAALADVLLHTLIPAAVPIYWLCFVPKGGLRRHDPWLWAIVPGAYFAYALARGVLQGPYAYPFMNVARIGWPRTVLNGLAIAAGFLVAGFVMLWLDRRLSRQRT